LIEVMNRADEQMYKDKMINRPISTEASSKT
jgi:hypothetical protein